jgi:hypothetical protein
MPVGGFTPRSVILCYEYGSGDGGVSIPVRGT